MPAAFGLMRSRSERSAAGFVGAVGSTRREWLWRTTMAGLFGAGVVSCVLVSRAETSWIKYQAYYQLEVARIINHAATPLVLVGGPIPLLGLTHFVHPEVHLQWAPASFESPPDGSSDTFVYVPTPAFLTSLARQSEYRLVPIHTAGKLWRLERLGPGR